MKRCIFSLIISCAITTLAVAADYHRISSFPIDGTSIRDTFLIVVEYAGNTYIWDGQNATGKNYVCLQNYSGDIISGDYADNEVAIVHNQWHSYNKLFSVLCKGDGDRDDKGGYYLAGVSGNNGISFSKGQVDAEITYEDTEGIKIATKSGLGIFRFNITPNDPHGFKFYQNPQNMLYPTLYVKGNNSRYASQVEYEDMSEDFNYAQADYYYDKTLSTQPTVHQWDFSLNAEDNDEAYPQIYLKLTNESNVAIAGSYVSTVADGKPWQVYCTNSSVKSSIYSFVSSNGNITTLYMKYCSLTLTPLRKDERGVYTYLIDLKWVDQNNKHRKVYKELPIIGVQYTYYSPTQPEIQEEIFFQELPDDADALTQVTPDALGIKIIGNLITSKKPIRIYNIIGQDVTAQNGNLKTGAYIVRTATQATKVIIH